LSLFELLFCYGLTFGMMNKTSWLQNRYILLDDMLSCSYCTGFHAGWISLLILHPTLFKDPQTFLFWAFVSSSFSYITDTFVAYLEDN
jgi:hypothetical protein